MDVEAERLLERWILAFCEPPPLIDLDLMRVVLAEHAPSADPEYPMRIDGT